MSFFSQIELVSRIKALKRTSCIGGGKIFFYKIRKNEVHTMTTENSGKFNLTDKTTLNKETSSNTVSENIMGDEQMKFEDVVLKLCAGESVVLGNGKIVVFKKMKEILAGVPVYNICMTFEDGSEPMEFDSVIDFNEQTIINKHGKNCFRCLVCGGFAENDGYYSDLETGGTYCSKECLTKYMNETFGEDSWMPISESPVKIRGIDGDFIVKIEAAEISQYDINEVYQIGEDYWRSYGIYFVPPISCYETVNGERIPIEYKEKDWEPVSKEMFKSETEVVKEETGK